MIRKGRFTLLELLAVIAIIAILAALLMPALRRARFAAVKAACMSDRRQNGIILQMYDNDFDGLLPRHGGSYSDPGAVGRSSWNVWQNSGHRGQGALGTLAKSGYVDAPELLFCPAFARPEGTHYSTIRQWFYDQPDVLERHNVNPNFWEDEMVGAQGDMPKAYGGIVAYPTGSINGEWSTWGEYGIRHIADNWDKSFIYGSPAPFLVSCADYGNTFVGHTGRWPQGEKQGMSHDRRGLNVLRFDGSVRWTPMGEFGPRAFNSNEGLNDAHPGHDTLQKHARVHMQY